MENERAKCQSFCHCPVDTTDRILDHLQSVIKDLLVALMNDEALRHSADLLSDKLQRFNWKTCRFLVKQLWRSLVLFVQLLHEMLC